LAEAKSNKSYESQKSSLHKELVNFLSSLPVPKTLSSASPFNIKKFLVWKDNSGKTVAHLLAYNCEDLLYIYFFIPQFKYMNFIYS